MVRALASKPEVLLLESLIVFQTAEGITVIMSSHDLQQAGRLESNVIQLAEDELEQSNHRNNTAGKSRQQMQICQLLKMHVE